MCTALRYCPKTLYFGRTLDLEYSYDEHITITPRRFPLPFHHRPTLASHHAIIGTAYLQKGYPLYYDAMNEAGLCMAALRFPLHCVYGGVRAEKDNLASFELMPYVLGSCRDVSEAKECLRQIHITDTAFSPELPPSPLHWLLADAHSAITVEQTEEGLQVYDNSPGVLTNEPPFPMQLMRLGEFMTLSPLPPENRLAPHVPIEVYSRGLGAMGLPGDSSSPSRFVRALFHTAHSPLSEDEDECVAQVFHILQSVAQLQGSVIVEGGKYERTVYSACCSVKTGRYYYTSYENSALTAVSLRKEDLESTTLISYPMLKRPQTLYQNGK